MEDRLIAIFLRIVNNSAAACWLVLLVVGLRLLFRRAPGQVRMALWGVVGLRLILPFSLEAVWSLIPSAEIISRETIYASSPALDTGVAVLDQVVNPSFEAAYAPSPGGSTTPLAIQTAVWTLLWLLGLVLFLLYAAISCGRLRRRVAAAVPAEAFWGDRVYQCERVKSPFILGLIRPRIYLPFHLSEREKEAVVAHEKAHISRRDHWWKAVGFLLLAMHWFNPLIWLAYVLLCRDMEYACDERVICKLNREQRAGYCEVLLACGAGHRRLAAGPLAFGEVGVKARVKAVLKYRKPALWLSVTAAAACLLTAACFLTDPIAEIDGGGGSLEMEEYSSWGNGDYQIRYRLDLSGLGEGGTIYAEQWNNGRRSASAPIELGRDVEDVQIVLHLHLRRENGTISGVNIQVSTEGKSDALMTDFALPEDREVTGWSFAGREEGKAVSFGSGDEVILAALAFDEGNGVQAADCDRLTQEPELLEAAGSMIAVRACFGGTVLREKQEDRVGKPQKVLSLEYVDQTYVFQGSGQWERASLMLEKDGTFTFSFSVISDYIGHGFYQLQGDRLTLVTDDGKYVYKFDRVGDTLVFDGEESSEEVGYSGLYDGAVLR